MAKRSTIYGIGINDANHTTYTSIDGKVTVCPYYKTWRDMLKRCFSLKHRKTRPTYTNCTLEESWKHFSNFKSWMETQDWVGKSLDKDLLIQGNKHYGPNTCLFISKALNNLLCLNDARRGIYPLGVSLDTVGKYKYFKASCSFYGKRKNLGRYKTIEEAERIYKEEKLKYIAELAANEPNLKVKTALLSLIF